MQARGPHLTSSPSKPAKARSKVVFPAPDSPTIAVMVPGESSISTSSTTVRPDLTTEIVRITGSSKGVGAGNASPSNFSVVRFRWVRTIDANPTSASERSNSSKPRTAACSMLPFDVSRTMLVVITRVFPAIFPPTMMTAPTSAMARPKAMTTA